ncbi:MAG: CHASE2 domain-containing protein, partial [Nitrospira defluvii]|nr:CHASE2 domain-containing protein [Nitrospira defluvii]
MRSTPSQKKTLSAAAVGLAVFGLMASLDLTGWFEVAELKALDHLVRRYADPAKADPDLLLLAVDESSLEAFGRWPWPRDRFGYVVRYLKQAGAKAIVFDVLFLEPDENAEEFDQSFADDVKAAGNVFLPMLFQEESNPIPADVQVQATMEVEPRDAGRIMTTETHAGVKLPIPVLAQQARGLGAINLSADVDGPTRRIPLLGQVNGQLVPHLSLAAAQYLLGATGLSIQDNSVQIGPRIVPLGADGNMLIEWHGSLEQTYHARRYSIGRVLQAFAQQQKGERPSLDPALFKDKV